MAEYRQDGLKTRCLCGVHVHTATKILMWINIISSALYVLVLFVSMIVLMAVYEDPNANQRSTQLKLTRGGLVAQFIFNVFGTAIGLAPSAMVLYGLKTKRSGFYWPYLILMLISIIFIVIYLVISFVASIALAIGLIASIEGHSGTLVAGGLLGLNLLLLLIVTAAIYFNYIVVNRSRKLLEDEMYNPVPPPAYNPYV